MANSAVVGLLKAMLTADTSQFDAGMRKAATTAQQTEKTIEGLGKEVTKLTPQAERMVKAFSGDKLIYQAKNMAAAIDKIGGASKLTTAELERVGNVAKAAAEKMRALGVDVPKNIDALAKSATKSSGAMNLLSGGVSAFGATLAATFTFGAVVSAISKTGEWAGRIDDLSKKLGISREAVQRLDFAAQQNGSTIDQVSTAMSQLAKRIVEGDSSAAKALDRLNLSFGDLQALSPDQAFLRVARAIADLPDKFEQQATAMELLGRAGADLIPMFASLEQDMNRAVVANDDLVKAGDRLGDAWTALKSTGMALLVGVIAPSAPAFEKLAVAANRFAQSQLDAAEAQRRLREEFEKTGRIGDLNIILDQIERERMIGQAGRGVRAGAMPAPLSKQAFLPEDAERMMDRATRAVRKTNDEAVKLLTTQERMNGLAFTYAKYLESWAPAIQNANESAHELTNFADNLAGLSQAMPAWLSTDRVSEEVSEIEPVMSRLQQAIEGDFESMSLALSDAFAGMLLHTRSFKDSFLNIWESIKQGITNILGDILNQFVGGFLRSMVGAASGGRLGGAGGGGGIAGTAGSVASSFGMASLFGGGGGAGVAMTVDTLPGAAAGGAAGGGIGMGFLANPAFWTNPWTIGVGAGIAGFFLAKHFLGGSEESKKVSPARDSFFGQFVGMFGGSPYEAIVKAFQRARVSATATDSAISGLYNAHTYTGFQSAERRALNLLAAGGLRGLQSFQFGGFTPPHTEQLALVHGGSMGELHIPVQQLAAMQAAQPSRSAVFNFHIAGVLDRDSVRAVFREHIIPEIRDAFYFDRGGVVTSLRRELA